MRSIISLNPIWSNLHMRGVSDFEGRKVADFSLTSHVQVFGVFCTISGINKHFNRFKDFLGGVAVSGNSENSNTSHMQVSELSIS